MNTPDTAASALAASPAAGSPATENGRDSHGGTKMYVGYLRVSTARQGDSGLGLEAQRATISAHISGSTASEFVEVESGRRDNRPQLAKALAECRRIGATLIIAKLDRLSRNTRFLLALIDSNVELIFCDLPQCSGPAGRMMLTVMGAFAEMEAGLISERTKAALAAAKARGVRLGNPNGAAALVKHIRLHGNASALKGKIRAAIARAEVWRDTMESLIAEGLSNCAIARVLNERGEKSVQGGCWSACSVGRIRVRLAIV